MQNKNVLLRERAELTSKLNTIKDGLKYAGREPSEMDRLAMGGYAARLEEINMELAEHARLSTGFGGRGDYPENFIPVGRPGGEAPSMRSRGRGGFLSRLMATATDDELEQVNNMIGAMRGTVALANLVPSGDGGYLIPSFVAAEIEINVAAFTPVLNVARVVATEDGAPFVYPVLSDSESATQLAPSDLTGLDATVSGDTPPTSLTGPKLGAWKVSSKPQLIPRETQTDSSVDIFGDLVEALVSRISRFENLKYTRGNGTTEAEGFVQNCTHYNVSGPLTLDMALDLTLQVPPLYRPNGVYMASDKTIKYLKKIKTGIAGDLRPLWSFGDSGGDGTATEGTPPTLWGYPILTNNDLPDIADSGYIMGHELAFGDFKRFLIRRAESGQPYMYVWPIPARDGRGIIALRRTDSKLLVPTAIATVGVGGS
jgi:HK97 family phage major capsid protein